VGVNVDETERAELIAALHQAATFGEGLLGSERATAPRAYHGRESPRL
jgi:hypothetical protein